MSILTNILESTIGKTIRKTSVKATLNTLAIVLLTAATALGTITVTGCQKENEEVVITIDTQPQQARIFIDDHYVGVSPLTLSVADAPTKRYQVTAKKTGFYTYRTETTLVSDYSIALLPHEREIRLKITPGANRVSLHSTALNTPLVYTVRPRATQEISATLPYGTYTLFAWRQGLSFLEKTFIVDEQTPPTIPVKFSEVFARTALTVTSRPANAQVYYQDLLLGETPLTLSNLASGTTFLRVAKRGYHDVTVSVNLRPNEQKNIPLTLAKQLITRTVVWEDLPRPVTLSFTQTQTDQGTTCIPNCKKNTWQFSHDREELTQAANPISLSLAPGTYKYSILSPKTYPYSGEILIAGEAEKQALSPASRTAEKLANTASQETTQVITQSPVLRPRFPATLKPIARISLAQRSLSEQGTLYSSSQQEKLIAAANQTILASQGKLTGLLYGDTGIYLQQHNLPHAWNHVFKPLPAYIATYTKETSGTTSTTSTNTLTQPPSPHENKNGNKSWDGNLGFVAAPLPLTPQPLITLAATLSRIHAKDILSPFFIFTEKRTAPPSFAKDLNESPDIPYVFDVTYVFDNSQSTLTRNISSPHLSTYSDAAPSKLIAQEQVNLKECLYAASRTDDGEAGTEGLVLPPIVGQAVIEAGLSTETKIVFSDTANDRVWRLHWEEDSRSPTCSLLLLKNPSSEAFARTSPKSTSIQSLTLLQYAQGERPILSVGEKETMRVRLYSDEGEFFNVHDLGLATSSPPLNKRFASLSALIPSWLRKESTSENFDQSINTLLYLFAPMPNVLVGLVEHRFPAAFTYSLYVYDISPQ